MARSSCGKASWPLIHTSDIGYLPGIFRSLDIHGGCTSRDLLRLVCGDKCRAENSSCSVCQDTSELNFVRASNCLSPRWTRVQLPVGGNVHTKLRYKTLTPQSARFVSASTENFTSIVFVAMAGVGTNGQPLPNGCIGGKLHWSMPGLPSPPAKLLSSQLMFHSVVEAPGTVVFHVRICILNRSYRRPVGQRGSPPHS